MPWERLRDAVLRVLRGEADVAPDEAFDRLALDVFRFQFEHEPTYAGYCRARGATPHTIRHWTAIPAVPTAAFKEVRLRSGPETEWARVFRTSGTTAGAERRGEHHVPDTRVYGAALLAAFRAFVLPDGARPRVLSLMPSAAELADSSLAFMIDAVRADLGGASFATVAHGLERAPLEVELERHAASGTPVLLLGTSAAFIHWLDELRAEERGFELPAGSRLMDTGGYKGGGRRVDEAELRALYADRFGLADSHCVNEYGMTELGSQCYDTALRDAVGGAERGRPLVARAAPGSVAAAPNAHRGGRRKAGPPWLRTRVVDPETLAPVAAGEVGILQHYDLANVGSVMAVQTEDLGREVDGGFLLLGRAAGAPPRGCSIAMDLLLRSARERA